MKKNILIAAVLIMATSCKHHSDTDKTGAHGGIIVARNFADPNAGKFVADSVHATKGADADQQ